MAVKIYGAVAPWPFLSGLIRDNRPVWFCEEAGIPYERLALDPTKGENKSEEYTKINPFQKVPVLDDNGFVLTQSAGILHHLALSTGKFFPKDSKEQALHLSWMFYCMSDIEAHAVQLKVLKAMTDPKDAAHADWMVARAEKLLARALDYLESELTGKEFLMGSYFYAVDILLGCCLLAIKDHDLVIKRTNINNLLKRYYSRPAFLRMLEINGKP